jgi:Lectin C-type domain
MRVRIAPLERERSYSRRARMAGSSAALCFATAGCADVLDIPEQPRLGNDTPVSPRPARTEQAAGLEIDVASGAEDLTARADADVTARAGEGQLTAPQFDGSRPSPVSTPSAPAQAPETADAGARGDSLAAPDATAPPPSPPACAASGVVGPDGSCYAPLTTLRTWAGARQGCRSLGAGWDLASIRSDEVNRFLAELLPNETWIGASDGSVEGSWIWVDDGTPFWRGDSTGNPVGVAYVNWDQTQPNGGVNVDCARLVPAASGAWGDLSCAELRRAVCAGSAG